MQRNRNVEPHIVHSSVKGGRKALDNGMVTAAPRIYVENHHANLVIRLKFPTLYYSKTQTQRFFIYTRKYDIASDVVLLCHKQLFLIGTDTYKQVLEFYCPQR